MIMTLIDNDFSDDNFIDDNDFSDDDNFYS